MSLVAMKAGHRESEDSWSAVLRDLRECGMNAPRLVLVDGNLGIWAGLRNVFPEAEEQRCWNHRIINILTKIPKRSQPQARMMLRAIPYTETAEEAVRLRACSRNGAALVGCIPLPS